MYDPNGERAPLRVVEGGCGEPLPSRPNPRRCDLEGELIATVGNGCYVFQLDETLLAELLAFHFKVRKGDPHGTRAFGRCRVTVEQLPE